MRDRPRRAVRSLILAAWGLSLLAVTACSDREGRPPEKPPTGRAPDKVAQCLEPSHRTPRVPILGGGFLNIARFGFSAPHMRIEDGECGTDGFESVFYWTGDRILPAGAKFTGLKPIPSHWVRFEVSARLSNKRRADRCQAGTCADLHPQDPGLPSVWPPERIVRPKAYPGLEVWLAEKALPPPPGGLHFVMKGWPREDGVTPRSVHCSPLPQGMSMDTLSRQDLEDLDLSKRAPHGSPCRVEFTDFVFRGGAARVETSTLALPQITPALQALQQYLSFSVTPGK